jgi:hypothetical protein
MNCTEFNNYLNDGIDQELDGLGVADAGDQAAFNAHRASCAVCQATYAEEMAMLESLRAMPVPTPSEGFADRVLANAFKEGRGQDAGQNHRHRQGFMLGFGSAAAAALAVWVVVGMFPGELPDATPAQTVASVETTNQAVTHQAMTKAQPVVSIALNEKKSIKLAFFSAESLQGAKITIRLPENVALVGYPGRRQLSWETNLKKGDNLLSLPVIATQVALGELIADIEYEGRVKTLRLNLETGAANTSAVDNKLHPLIG